MLFADIEVVVGINYVFELVWYIWENNENKYYFNEQR